MGGTGFSARAIQGDASEAEESDRHGHRPRRPAALGASRRELVCAAAGTDAVRRARDRAAGDRGGARLRLRLSLRGVCRQDQLVRVERHLRAVAADGLYAGDHQHVLRAGRHGHRAAGQPLRPQHARYALRLSRGAGAGGAALAGTQRVAHSVLPGWTPPPHCRHDFASRYGLLMSSGIAPDTDGACWGGCSNSPAPHATPHACHRGGCCRWRRTTSGTGTERRGTAI